MQIHLAKFFNKQRNFCEKRQKKIAQYKSTQREIAAEKERKQKLEEAEKQKKRKLEEEAEEARKVKRARKEQGHMTYLEEARKLAHKSGYAEVQHVSNYVVGFVHHPNSYSKLIEPISVLVLFFPRMQFA